jgi:hypothetical protein
MRNQILPFGSAQGPPSAPLRDHLRLRSVQAAPGPGKTVAELSGTLSEAEAPKPYGREPKNQ